ncbi:MAG TPA: hypothetical protein VKA07_10980 [Candidatus Sulfotelmatobacter sp.]|nr:hypothetical protein [Candidatus Sulfotelmatobacter sp.]
MKRHMLTISLVILGTCVLGVSASAQEITGPDVFKINYFANNGVAGAPDATVRIDNPGTVETEGGGSPESLCAMIYVFDNDQQLSECCGCLVTPNGLRTLSVSKDLTSNPLTGVVSNNGVIKIVSELPNRLFLCDPTTEVAEAVATVRAWASHVQNKVGAAYPITETAFTDATLSQEEFSFNLIEQCSFAQRLGSGKAVCTCGTGD